MMNGTETIASLHPGPWPLRHRRDVLRLLAATGGAWFVPGAFAEALVRTPRQTAGPFYPDQLPLDTDNDLIIVDDRITPAVGEITHLSGRVLTASGSPVRNAVVEIWQVDSRGVYLHSRSPHRDRRDGNFQGFGRFQTGTSGEYRFRTIKPVPYSFGAFRPPHIHVAVDVRGRRTLTTQLYIKDHPQNRRDPVLNFIRDPREREALLVDFVPVPDSTLIQWSARFDIILGHTPADPA